ncbi:intradiol ring-cleavage dioxygenase [Massilia sp. METH4]|uniref:intradiol ring-cleavage dioxygenase n=1 Tax=Massilia sp. METH4 TaxID=3123041 RepID=UPI0030CFE7DA
MKKLLDYTSPKAHEEAPTEFLVRRKTVLTGLMGAVLTPVSSLLSPVFAQENIKQAAEIGDMLDKIPNMCRLATAALEGPYYIDQRILRSDIREDQPGIPLELELQVVNANASCAPVKGIAVSIWHCNAEGEYSGYLFNDPNKLPDMRSVNELGHVQEKDNERWLRGVQTTDANGKVKFRTIVPGWYSPRAAHIHVRAFLSDRMMMTTQLYFPQSLLNTIQATHKAYRHRGPSVYTNENDVVRRQTGIAGMEDVLKVTARDDGTLFASMALAAGHV